MEKSLELAAKQPVNLTIELASKQTVNLVIHEKMGILNTAFWLAKRRKHSTKINEFENINMVFNHITNLPAAEKEYLGWETAREHATWNKDRMLQILERDNPFSL